MDKIKSLLKPGGKQEDDVMYGSGQSGVQSEQDPGAMLHTDPGADKKDHGILRQILNPGGEKYEETRYGTTAHADGPVNIPTTGTETHSATNAPQIEPLPQAEDNKGMMRQVLNPGGEKLDDVRYGETGKIVRGSEPDSRAAAGPSGGMERDTPGQASHGLSRGEDAALGGAAAAGIGATGYEASRQPRDDLAGGAYAPHSGSAATTQPRDDIAGATYTDRSFPVGGHTSTSQTMQPSSGQPAGFASGQPPSDVRETALAETGSGIPGQMNQGSAANEPSHFGRDAGIAGGVGAGVLGAGALAEHEHQHAPRDDFTPATHTAGSEPVGGAAPFHQDGEQPVEGYVHHASGPHKTDIANKLDPHVPGEYPSESGVDPHAHGDFGRDAALGTTAATGAAGLGAAGYEAGRRDEPSTTSTMQPSQPFEGTSSQMTGEELPIRTTTNTLHSGTTVAQSDEPRQSEHHYGRDAALAGGAGAAGIGAYELGSGRQEPAQSFASHQPETSTHPVDQYNQAGGATATGLPTYGSTTYPGETGAASSGATNVMDPGMQTQRDETRYPATAGEPVSDTSRMGYASAPPVETQAQEPEQHHYGRDAAVAGGAGAAGLGAYEASKAHDQGAATTQPTSAPQQEAVEHHDHHGHHDHNKLHKRNDPRGHQEDKHERDLQKAREEEAARGGDHGEKKQGLLSRIMHPHHKDKQGDESQHPNDGIVIEPHTGLPMNVGKYGSVGRGGTDGAQQIEGYHETDPAVRSAQHGTAEATEGAHPNAGQSDVGPDWEQIKKANTPY